MNSNHEVMILLLAKQTEGLDSKIESELSKAEPELGTAQPLLVRDVTNKSKLTLSLSQLSPSLFGWILYNS